MQLKSTLKMVENASVGIDSPSDYLESAESKCVGLHTMATALTELLSAPYDGDYSPAARRRLGAAMEIAFSVEERAEEATELVQDARMIVLDLQRSEASQLSLDCSRKDFQDYHDAVGVILDDLRVAFLAVLNRDWHGEADVNAIASHIDATKERVTRIRDAMAASLGYENGRPDLRQDQAAEAGAA